MLIKKNQGEDSPQLRFPEFSGEWKRNKLGDFSNKVGSGSTPKGGDEVYQTKGVPFIRSQNVIGNRLVLDEVHISEEIHDRMKGSTVKANDVLLNITGGSIGRSCVVPKDFNEGNVNQHVCIIRLNDGFVSELIQGLLASEKGQKLIHEGQTGSGREGLNFQSIRLFHFNLPSLPEQQKIADFLSAVDQKISQLTEKKALLEQYKKGVMQQIFSQEIRFKDDAGNAFPDWEEKKLGDIGKVKMCKRIFSNQTTEKGDIPFFKIGTFGKEPDAYIPKALYKEFKEKYSFPKVGDILMSASGTLGRTVVYDGVDAYFQDSNIVWLDNDEKLTSNKFLFYVYQIVRYESEGGTIQRLYNSIISNAKYYNPSLPEQQKIADFLSAIDKKIEAVGKQLDKTQTFKKGLLQQMFV